MRRWFGRWFDEAAAAAVVVYSGWMDWKFDVGGSLSLNLCDFIFKIIMKLFKPDPMTPCCTSAWSANWLIITYR